MLLVDDAKKRFEAPLWEYAVLFREMAGAVENNPDCVFDVMEHPAMQALYQLRTLSGLTFFTLYEALAYGDLGVLFACPRTCLSGIFMQWVGSEAQQDEYFDCMRRQPQRTFFAMTEPDRGSDASQLETHFDRTLQSGKIMIQGEKMLVGNLGIANTGIIVGRTHASLLGITAVWIKPEDFANNRVCVDRYTLSTVGIRPALLGYAKFDRFVVDASQCVGAHKSPTERGLHALIKTFNVMRLGVAGLALGHAASVVDYIIMHRHYLKTKEAEKLAQWEMQIQALRQLSMQAAEKQAHDPLLTSLISLAKVRASHLAEIISTEALDFFPGEVLFEHPFLMRRLRDCFGYEYMDGTTHVQRKNIYQGYSKGDFLCFM